MPEPAQCPACSTTVFRVTRTVVTRHGIWVYYRCEFGHEWSVKQ